MAVIDFHSLDIRNKRVLIREDLNVPVKDGFVTSDARLRKALPTIEYAVNAGAKVMVMSHLGRPEEGRPIAEQPEFSLRPVADRLQILSGMKVKLVDSYLDGSFSLNPAEGSLLNPAEGSLLNPAEGSSLKPAEGSHSETNMTGGQKKDESFEKIILFENVRINPGEKDNDLRLAKQIASLCDIYVMDAFGTAHRAQATTEGAIRFAPVACAGPLLKAELDALGNALSNPDRPSVAIVGGSKVSTKLQVLQALSGKVDQLIVGGGIANTFLAAQGVATGRSLCETDMLDMASNILQKVKIPLPVDVVVSRGISPDADCRICGVDEIDTDEMIVDVGPETLENMQSCIMDARTILWNGPVGVFEIDQFAAGTRGLAQAIAKSPAFSVAGGGDTLAAIDNYGIGDDISYISTGGGAFLEFVEGKTLPAVSALEARAARDKNQSGE